MKYRKKKWQKKNEISKKMKCEKKKSENKKFAQDQISDLNQCQCHTKSESHNMRI